MKINFLKKKNNFKKKDFVFNPNLYWKITIFGIFILMILSFFFGYYLFKQTNQEIVLQLTDNGEQIPTIDKDRIAKVLNYFSERDTKSNQIINSPSPVVDPSL